MVCSSTARMDYKFHGSLKINVFKIIVIIMSHVVFEHTRTSTSCEINFGTQARM